MSHMAGTTMTLFIVAMLSGNFIGIAYGNVFLKANPTLRQERVSEEDVQTSLLTEVESAFGEGSAGSRVKHLEALLGPIYAALPKNANGYVGHATVRYALHRLFVQRHGWFIKGLDTAGGLRNSTTSAGLLKEQVPAYIQDIFEQRLGSRGLGVQELAVLAATIEHLVHNEAIKRVGGVFKIHDLLPTDSLDESMTEEVLETYMTAFIHGEDPSTMAPEDALQLKADMPTDYMAWNETREFVRDVRRDCAKSDGNAEQKGSGNHDFALVARVAERVSEQFGSFQDRECRDLKAKLVKMEEQDTGRVRLSDFYKPALDGNWQFTESVVYLRQLGALDESDADKPRVIIANYLGSATNCLASSNFYSVCCMDECEALLGHLEQHIKAPEATTAHIVKLVSELSSSSVAAPRQLSSSLLDRLGEIAAEHGGTVPLHGRLFAQWMHHAFPRECPYPHLSGSTNPIFHVDYEERTGENSTASEEEMFGHVQKAKAMEANEDQKEVATLPWVHEEELLVLRQPQAERVAGNSLLAHLRNSVLFMAVVSIAYGLVQTSAGAPAGKGCIGAEKFMV